MEEIKIFDKGNSQTDAPIAGIFLDNGIYTAMTYTVSKDFKTLKGAERFMKKRGF
jgi:hypothetical protein